MRREVVKLGGSLYRDPDRLATALAWLTREGVRTPLVVVPGGGPYADAVRARQQTIGGDDEAAHLSALEAMDRAARWLVDTQRIGRICDHLDALDSAGAPIAVYARARDFAADETLPRSWDTTSDTIALAVAQAVDAPRLTLVKSIPPPSLAPAELAAAGFLDRAFPARLATHPLPVTVLAVTGPPCRARRIPLAPLKFPDPLDDTPRQASASFTDGDEIT